MAATQAAKGAYKAMRKGTRACRECRRRKIRCIYNDEQDEICQECTLHKRECVKQGVVRGSGGKVSSSNVKVQVTRLESAVEKLARDQKTRHRQPGYSPSLEAQEKDAADLVFVDELLKKRSPIYSLFDNEFIAQDDTTPTHGPDVLNSMQFLRSDLTDREKLLSTIEHVPDILLIMDHASEWWISWREQHFALRKAAASLSLKTFVQRKLSQESVVQVALGLLAAAMALHQLRPGIDDLSINLPVPANQVVSQILAAVDQIVCDSEKYKTDPDVIVLLMIRAKHHTENNQLRKSWLRIRQGIRSAQAIGFGVANPLNPALSEEEAEQQRFIASIFEVDHLISMVLGFPYAKDPAFTDARAFSVLLDDSIQDEELRMRALRRVITVAAGNINDRNATGDIDDAITESTQATLDMAANCMPPGWWSLLSQPLSGVARYRYESILVQTWFWVVQSYLHMPYVIRPNRTHAAQRYRCLGLEAARNLIRTFTYLRTEPSCSVYLCNCDDFQALLGSCILLVGVLQNLSEEASSPTEGVGAALSIGSNDVQIEADLALVEDLKDIFRYRMTSQGGGISKQGLAVLEEMTSLLYEDEVEERKDTSFKGDVLGIEIDLSKRQKTIMLPYFGTIKIELTRRLPKRRPQQASQHVFMTPPGSINGSCSEYSPDVYRPVEGLLAYNYDQAPELPNEVHSYITSAPAEMSKLANNEPMFPIGTDSLNQAFELDMPPISWEQWAGYVYNDAELEQSWNPGHHWNSNPLLYQ